MFSVSFLNYGYLLDEDAGHGIDILLHKHVFELADTSANIAQSKFHEVCVITW